MSIKINYITILFVLVSSLSFGQEISNEDSPNLGDEYYVLNGIPPYPNSCKKVSNDYIKTRDCLSAYIHQFVAKKIKFTDLYKYPEGKYKIKVQFKINKKGKIENVKAKAKYQVMIDEAIRVIEKLPKMNPGILDGKPVGVLYGLPINLIIPKNKDN